MAPRHYDRCCNPFNLISHLKKRSSRHPSDTAMVKCPTLCKKDLLCPGCRIRIDKMEMAPVVLELGKATGAEGTPELGLMPVLERESEGFRQPDLVTVSEPESEGSRQSDLVTVSEPESEGSREPDVVIDFEPEPEGRLTPNLEPGPVLQDRCVSESEAENELAQSQSDECTPISLESLSQEMTAIASQTSNLSASITLPVINDALQLLDNSPIPKKRLKTANNSAWISTKVETVANSLKRSLGVDTSEPKRDSKNFAEMLAQLKTKYHQFGTSRDDKFQILTILPQSWSISEVVRAMDCTRYMAKVAKKLVEEKGILSTPGKNRGKALSTDVASTVVRFYEDDEMSAPMPGMKDFISVKTDDGPRVHRQKRLILSNLKELYRCFKERNPELSVGFSTFASLRPKHCVLAGDTSSTHSVCVCSIHQNMKLMINGSNLPTLTKNLDHPLETYEDVLMILTCDDIRAECNLGTCKRCPGVQKLKTLLIEIFKENHVHEVKYKQWISKPRTTLESQIHSAQKFADHFSEQAKGLLTHAFIAKQQAKFFKLKKNNLREGEVIVICDFAENYAFVVQDAAPGFHWNNNQATIYPVVVYYKIGNGLQHKSLAVVSECLHHDAIAVYEFSKVIIEFVKTVVTNLSKVIYVSDGAPQQYKNFKNSANVYYHEYDFGVPAEWHFFATAHGKGPCDGIGGTIKRLASRASLQLPADKQITTPRELYDWASTNIPSVKMVYRETIDYDRSKEFLINGRFKIAKPIKSTQKNHCVIPVGNGKVITKRYSLSDNMEYCQLIKEVK